MHSWATDSKAWLFYGAVGSFIAGVFARSFIDLGSTFALLFVVLGAALLFLYILLHREFAVLCTGVLLFAAGAGILRFEIADTTAPPLLENRLGDRVEVVGTIVSEPDERTETTQLMVSLERIGTSTVETDVNALVLTDRFPRFAYGDTVRASGELTQPENFESGSGRTFNYVQFLKKDDILYQIPFADVERIESGGGNPVKRNLFALKRAFLHRVGEVVPEPQASLLGGLVVGAKQSLGDNLQDAFRATGIIHIVVLSGYNVTLVAEAFTKFFSFLPAAFSWMVGGGAIVLFAIMTGASATVVRASIMAVLVLIARATGRTYAITRALFAAAFLMVLHNPMIVAFDPSFQLSFLASLGLLWIAPVCEYYVRFLPAAFQLRSVAAATVATQLFVLPLLLFMTGQFSLVSLPVNLLILVFVPMTMLFGFLAGVVGFVSTIASLPFAFIAYTLLSYELWVVDVFNSLPFTAVQLPPFSFVAVVVAYILYGFIVWKLYRRERIAPR